MSSIQIKPKKCRGTGKASGHGCGSMQLRRKYGLGFECGCYQKWLISTEEGKEVLNKASIRGKKIQHKKSVAKKKEEKENNVDYSKKLQQKVQEIARLIDVGQPCLSKKIHAKQMHGGHVFSRGGNSNIRYNLHNIHRQSAQSNHFQNDDANFREGIKKEYGKDYLEYISSLRKTQIIKYTNSDFKEFYKKACMIANRLRKEGKVMSKIERLSTRDEINEELGIYKNTVEYNCFCKK
jgi:hypothetical protein